MRISYNSKKSLTTSPTVHNALCCCLESPQSMPIGCLGGSWMQWAPAGCFLRKAGTKEAAMKAPLTHHNKSNYKAHFPVALLKAAESSIGLAHTRTNLVVLWLLADDNICNSRTTLAMQRDISISYGGIPGGFGPESQAQLAQPGSFTYPDQDALSHSFGLPSFMRILASLLHHTKPSDNPDRLFLTDFLPFFNVAFSAQRPIIGTGHHFVVYANPFDDADRRNFRTARDINTEVYCTKAPNLISNRPGGDFRNDYYNTVLRELRVLFHPALSTHENILGLDFQEDYDDFEVAWPVMVMEYAEYGTLHTLQQDVILEPELTRWLLLGVASGLQALHDSNIIHGDVKSENVLICRLAQRKYVARLSDFGFSVTNPPTGRDDLRLRGGTGIWAAPEYRESLSAQGLRQTDVYSFGLTAWRVLVNQKNPYSLLSEAAPGFQANSNMDELAAYLKRLGAFQELVLQSLPPDAAARPYPRRVIEATPCRSPANRELGEAITALALGDGNASQG
jgi:tRNA A-37 threonylcarbamoyl transferase component Bud32